MEQHSTQLRCERQCQHMIHTVGACMQVLEVLPPDWPIKTVKAFLLHSLRSNVHTCRLDKIEQNLARGENLQVGPPLHCNGSSKLISWFLIGTGPEQVHQIARWTSPHHWNNVSTLFPLQFKFSLLHVVVVLCVTFLSMMLLLCAIQMEQSLT